LSHKDEWFKKHYKNVIFFTSISYLALAYLVSFFPRDLFIRFSHEDNLVENLQFVVLVLGSIWSWKIATRLYRTREHVHAVIFYLASLGLFFVAGDEISWGQRIFHIATPASMAAINSQQEITIHNLTYFSGLVGITYAILGFYGTIAWIIQKFFPRWKNPPIAYYIPPWWCVVFYFSGFAYNYYVLTRFHPSIGVWSESAELMLYAGIMCTLLSLQLKLRPKR
jgi:hypothetical protein